MKVIKSYNISLTQTTRKLTTTKRNIINNFVYKVKSLYNYISKVQSEGYDYWKGMTKEDISFVRNHYEKEFQNDHNLKSGHAQNIYKNGKAKYIETIKSYNSKYVKDKRQSKNIKTKTIKPYYENCVEFPLDDRMLSKNKLVKDENIDNLYWLSILNPFKKNDKNTINIPLFFYKEIEILYNKGYKYSFSINKDYVKIIFTYEINDNIIKELKNSAKEVKNISIDFGKYISTFDGKNSSQYNLGKMYRKIHKLQGQISIYQRQVDNIKNSYLENNIKDYTFTKLEEFKSLVENIKKLNNRIKGIRKSTYNHVIKKIVGIDKNTSIDNDGQNVNLVIEDLTFEAIEKVKSSYKGKKFNKILNVMGKGLWLKAIEQLAGSHCFLLLKEIDPKYSSQECYACKNIDKSSRNGRVYKCKNCGHESDADINAAMNIYHRLKTA